MRSIALVLCSVIVWGLIAPAVFGADPVNAQGNPVPVAGEYRLGSIRFGDRILILSANGQYNYTARNDCLGVDSRQGEHEVKNGMIIFKSGRPGPRLKSPVYYSVRWGGRMYLIPQSDMIDFCTEVNHDIEPRNDKLGQHYYLRDGDWGKPVTGRPQLPKEFEKQFGPNPMKGKIVELSGKAEAWVDFGSNAVMEVGKTLYVQGTPGMCYSKVRIVEVEGSRCRIKPDGQTDLVKVGNSVSSWRPYSFLP